MREFTRFSRWSVVRLTQGAWCIEVVEMYKVKFLLSCRIQKAMILLSSVFKMAVNLAGLYLFWWS